MMMGGDSQLARLLAGSLGSMSAKTMYMSGLHLLHASHVFEILEDDYKRLCQGCWGSQWSSDWIRPRGSGREHRSDLYPL